MVVGLNRWGVLSTLLSTSIIPTNNQLEILDIQGRTDINEDMTLIFYKFCYNAFCIIYASQQTTSHPMQGR
jgi:hypothetical protein